MKRMLVAALVLGAAACSGDDPERVAAAAERLDAAPAVGSVSEAPASPGAGPAEPGEEVLEHAAQATERVGGQAPTDQGVDDAAGTGAAATATEQAQRRVVYVDVRRPDEFAAGHVVGAIHIPHTEMADRLHELEEYRDADVVLYCRTGRRSGIAEQILRQAGFDRLHNGGGLSDLERQGIPTTR
jgi:phage shock protein E